MCGRGASPESPRSKFAVVDCGTDSLTILCSFKFTCTKCVTELNTTADASKTRSKIVNSLHYYVHASLLNHMTIIITKVGASYIDHMNDDALEVDSFSLDVTRLSPLPASEERAWGQGYGVEG